MRSAGAVVCSEVSSVCVGCSMVVHLSVCSGMSGGMGVVAPLASILGLGAKSTASVSVGSLTGGVEVTATGFS